MSDTTIPLTEDEPNQPPPADPPEAPPGFELLDEVGRGGMGVVYRARDLALNREVAVKYLQDRFDPDSLAASRFVEEARITGQLQHPGVPAVHQVGLLSDGRPYLVMKLIKGSTLDDLLKQGATIDPLSIFEAVAQTVAHAHAHGVIHRDLKPANVMVGDFGEAQVMDWGLAKALGAPAGALGGAGTLDADPEATTVPNPIRSPRGSDDDRTRAGSVMGTPAYMAPEQASGDVDKVGARSDVFGLGAILCALLTGKPPFVGQDSESVRRAAAAGQTKEAFARLDASGADPDVVALCKRCLAFDPAQRPASGDMVAAEVATLRRAADERARRAERDLHAAEARAEEQAKRRRTIQWAAAAVIATLLLGVIGTGVGMFRAIAAQRVAEDKEAEANAVVQFFEDHVFAAGRPKGQQGGLGVEVSLRDALSASLPALEKAFPNHPLVEARLRATLGLTFFFLGEAKRAAEQQERARALFTRHRGPDHPDTLSSMSNLAAAYYNLGRRDETLKLNERTLAGRRRVLGPDHPDTLTTMNNLAHAYNALGRPEEALKLREETLAARRRVLPPDHPDTLQSMTSLAAGYYALGRHDDALKLRAETLASLRRVLGPDHPDTLLALNNLATSHYALGHYEEALNLGEETLEARKRALGPDHPDTLQSMSNLAATLQALGRGDEARKLFEELLATQRRLLGPEHPDTLISMNNLAAGNAASGRYEDARKLFEETLAARGRVLPPDHPNTLRTMINLAAVYEALGRGDEALKLSEKALAAQRRALGPDHPDTLDYMGKVAESLVALDRGAEAISLIDECVAKASGKAVDPWLIPAVMDLRLRHFQKAGDPEGCRTTAAMWEGLNRADAASLYDAACFRAVAAAIQMKAGGDDARRLAREDADRAMEWLKKAVAAGFATNAHMEQDADLDALRDREDFKELLGGER